MSDAVDPILGMHWQLLAYISAASVLKVPAGETRTFTSIVQNYPKQCRYAVGQRVAALKMGAGKVTLTAETGPFVVWDLHDDLLVRGKRTGPNGLIMPPPPCWMAQTVDAAVMKAVMGYDRPSN